MGRKGRIWCAFLTLLCSCSSYDTQDVMNEKEVCIKIRGSRMSTRSADPDENLLTSLSLFVFDSKGFLEEQRTFSRSELHGNEELSCSISLMKGKEYSIYACANMGMDIKAGNLEEIRSLRFHLAYPDDYRTGMPMAGKAEGVCIDDSSSVIEVKLQRLMSKISLRMDRGGLSEGTSMRVVSVKIGNCPRSATVFESSRVLSEDACFPAGFIRSESECSILNRNTVDGISGAISLYMLENMQGTFSPDGIADDSDKVFDETDIRSSICSYIEMGIDYSSPAFNSLTKPLIYRFYLGEGRNSLDIERNCHYHITVIPEDDGLSDEGWRVDKEGLAENESEVFFDMSPSGYIQAAPGDRVHVRCSFIPESAPFDIGLEELEEDRMRGIYDYEIDEDGRGVILTIKAPGTGILYMTAGEPINESGMLVIEVIDIKNNIS